MLEFTASLVSTLSFVINCYTKSGCPMVVSLRVKQELWMPVASAWVARAAVAEISIFVYEFI
jgi:hypothetical protein